jgi:peptidoglycan/xylan/chitin deacetylase (PgdA/CDA1 family)
MTNQGTAVASRTPGPRVKRALRRTLGRAAGLAARVLPRPDLATRRLILCYHSIHPSVHYASASPETFAAHLDRLQATVDIVDLREIVAVPEHGPSERPRVALTFDDGYADNYDFAFPLLLERGITATFFVTVGFLERDPEVMSRLADIWRTPRDELAPLGWRQVEEMRAAGMHFGSHTWSHPNLSELSPAEAASELDRSKAILEDRTGQRVDAIAYPFGKWRQHVDETTLTLAGAAGYTHGYASLPRAIAPRDDRLRIPRFGVGDDTVAGVSAKVAGEIDWHASVHEHLPRQVSRALFPVYP